MESKFARNVMMTREFDDSVYYRISCECGEADHDVNIEFEFDKKYKMCSIHFYKDLSYDNRFWFENNLLINIKKFWERVKAATRILFTGYIKVNEELLIMDIDHFDSVMECIKEGRKFLEEFKEENK